MDACRWRATTVRTLREIETPTDTMRKVNELLSEFRTMVREKMHYDVRDVDLFGSDSVRSTFESVLKFCQILVGDRSRYDLWAPNFKGKFWKPAGDVKDMTTCEDVGVEPRMGRELDGDVALVVSPWLIKWGDGEERPLNLGVGLVKAFVQMVIDLK